MMKILMITPYVTINSRPEFCRNKTGFGYMVYDIAKSVGKIASVDVLASDSRGNSFEMEGVKYIKRSWWKIFKSLLKCLPFASLFSILRNYKPSIGSTVRLVYYWLMTGYLCDLLQKNCYDIVHIHGMKYPTAFWIEVCHRCNVKSVLTSHGLNSFSDTIKMEKGEKQYERDLLRKVINGEVNLTVISTGMKRLIERTFETENCPFITVVTNAFSFGEHESEGGKIDIRKLYGLPSDSIILLYVGNICRRKNQGQILEAYHLLPRHTKDNVYILFLGTYNDKDYDISKFVVDEAESCHFIKCGAVNKELVPQYYEQGDFVALISMSEGFGLSLIEGMHFGKPCICFTDMDAYEDIYYEEAVVGVASHETSSIAQGLQYLLSYKWDELRIKDYSKKFEPLYMANKYINEYTKMIPYTK